MTRHTLSDGLRRVADLLDKHDGEISTVGTPTFLINVPFNEVASLMGDLGGDWHADKVVDDTFTHFTRLFRGIQLTLSTHVTTTAPPASQSNVSPLRARTGIEVLRGDHNPRDAA